MHQAEPSEPTAGPPARPRCVVYTALFGQYERLLEQPGAGEWDADVIALTDDPSLTSDTWDVRCVEPAFAGDPIRSARWVKIAGHPEVAGYDHSIWVDNRVTLERDPVAVCDKLLVAEQADIALFEHSFRDRVIDEFAAVARGGYDDPNRVYEQLMHYADDYPEALQQKPYWTGFLVRRHTPALTEAMTLWAQHVLRYSRRDQLSVNLALSRTPVRVHTLTGSNRLSDYHAWPEVSSSLDRQVGARARSFAAAIESPLLRLRNLERDTADLLEAHRVSAEKKDALIARLKHRNERLSRDSARIRLQKRALEEKLTAAREAMRAKNERIITQRQRIRTLQARLQSGRPVPAPVPAVGLRARAGVRAGVRAVRAAVSTSSRTSPGSTGSTSGTGGTHG